MVKVLLAAGILASAAPAAAQAAPEGIPVTSDLVVSKCGSCHAPDDQGRMSRISYRRTTPEGWELTVKRMVALNRVPIEPTEARDIVKYLSDNHGLAPEEAKSVAFEAERRLVDFTYQADRETAVVCSSCHSMGRVMSQRRTKEEWELLLSMHRGYYPLVDNQPMNDGQGFRRSRAVAADAGGDGPPADTRQPMERIVAHLSKAFPLGSAEWADWSAARQPAALAGQWVLSGHIAGKGAIFGEVTMTADPQAPDTFDTETRYVVAGTGETVTRKGRGVVYGGFQWRGRSSDASAGADTWRETMFLERAQKDMSGRWFGGAYDELGVDVKLVRVGAEPIVLGSSIPRLRRASVVPVLRIYGANLPAGLRLDQVSFGQGVTVTAVVSSTPSVATVAVEVAADAAPGPRDLLVAQAHRTAALTVYDKVDFIRVMPQAGLARIGGAVFPKQFQQFEAVAFHNGPDGLANTSDDWNLGLVDAEWRLEEYAATFDDDDLKFVGAIDSSGLFTPAVDGPNPARSGERNNIGDVWVVATVPAAADRGIAAPIRARGHLVVAPPVYVKWSASEVGQ